MDLLFQHGFRIAAHDVDPFGEVRPLALMYFLQEAGRLHSERLRVTLQDLNRLGKTWVMAQYRVLYRHRPRIGEEVVVATWPSSREVRVVTRDFEVTDAAGRTVALASASYVVIDIETRRPVSIGDLLPDDFALDRRAIPDPPRSIPKPQRVDREIQLPVMMRDLDMNLHVNHVVYAQWALEAVPLPIWEASRLASIEIGYRAETRHGDQVKVAVAITERPDGADILHQINHGTSAAELARIRTRWTKKSGE